MIIILFVIWTAFCALGLIGLGPDVLNYGNWKQRLFSIVYIGPWWILILAVAFVIWIHDSLE